MPAQLSSRARCSSSDLTLQLSSSIHYMNALARLLKYADLSEYLLLVHVYKAKKMPVFRVTGT